MDAKFNQSSLWDDFIRLLLALKLNKFKLFNAALLCEKFIPKGDADIAQLIEWAEGAELVEATRYHHRESGYFYRVAKLGTFVERTIFGVMYEEEDSGRLKRAMTSCGPLTYQRAVRWVASRGESFVFRGDDPRGEPPPGGMPIYGRLLRQWILDELASFGLIKEVARRGGQVTYVPYRDKLLACLEAVSHTARAYLTALRWLAEHPAFLYRTEGRDKESRGGPPLFGPLTERYFLREAVRVGIIRECAEDDGFSYQVNLARLEWLLDPASDPEAVFSSPMPTIFVLCREVTQDEAVVAATPADEPAPEPGSAESRNGAEESGGDRDAGEGEENRAVEEGEEPEPAETDDEPDWHIIVLRAIRCMAEQYPNGRSVHKQLAREGYGITEAQVSSAIREMAVWGWLETHYQDTKPFLALTEDGREAEAAVGDEFDRRSKLTPATGEGKKEERTVSHEHKQLRTRSQRRLIRLQDACGGVGRNTTFQSRQHLAKVLGFGDPKSCPVLLDNAREAGILAYRSPGCGGGEWTVEFRQDVRQMWPRAAEEVGLPPTVAAARVPAARAPAPAVEPVAEGAAASAAESAAEGAATSAGAVACEECKALRSRVAELEEALLQQAAVRITAILNDLPADLRQRALAKAVGAE